ncbi:MAG: SH3 domain-containing protein [Bacteroidota bacterium]
MKKYKIILIFFAATLLICCSGKGTENTKQKDSKPIEVTTKSNNQIICDRFKINEKITNSSLNLSVDTDLPDNTIIMVSVSRLYWEPNNSSAYSEDYFSEKSTVGKWKSNQVIPINSKIWKEALSAKQKQMSRLGFGFDVESISNNITIRMVVPINQSNPMFGEKNVNLCGKAVINKGIRIVEDEIKIDYPLDSPPIGKSQYSNLNPLDLEIGQIYILSKQTPLMPSLNPDDPIAALEQIKQIPKGGEFKVLEMVNKNNNPWYKVIAFNQSKSRIGTGWINSTALLSQKLEISN